MSDKLNNPTYPGEGWALFDAGNPGHYPLTFINDEGQPEVAKYICFRSTEEDTYLVGTQGKNKKEYATPLQAKAYPSPNFNHHGVKDTDLNLFHPAHLSCLMVDTALVNLKDPGVLADVHRFRGLHNIISSTKRQRLELEKKETQAEADLLVVERCLASSAVCTCLQQHLLATHPPSPPLSLFRPVIIRSHVFSLPKVHLMSKKEKTIWKNALYLASGVGKTKSPSHTASGAIRMYPVTGLRSAPFGRHAAGASVLSTLTTSVPPPITPAQLTAASFTLGTPILVAIVRQPRLDIFATN